MFKIKKTSPRPPLQLLLGRLVEQVQLRNDVEMGNLKVDHSGQGRQNAGHKLGRLDHELRIEQEHTTDVEVPIVQLLH